MLKTSNSLPIYTIHNNATVRRNQTLKTYNIKSDQNSLLSRNGFTIQLVNSQKCCIKTNTLIKHMYASRGYLTKGSTVYPYNNPYQITFSAFSEENTIGTITLKIDSGSGLLADELYGQELAGFREKNRKICELSKFAVVPEYGSKELFATLFHFAYIYAYNIHNVEDAFIEINPRHASFYRRMLGFDQIGELRTCKRVDAPASLLHLNLDYMSKQISLFAGSRNTDSRSIYPYFLTQFEEMALTKKMRQALYHRAIHDIPAIPHSYEKMPVQ
ncbi:MAG: long-chain N-acyl amino acid synthase [Burkholderiales bacterium]|nr:long-chain N-acyl amino acid synthase [Nitrosomonas sp.]MCB1948255.1 long-chain N-acyl amino acid synthase [Nitrosomonas sp.]MCP5243403.1 long-chain N-acyl amino acid synthase [Burkholderiales bacterium]MDR4514845.1 long-chain N-acyl amino acid synthase [Nitrosomonas sp.]